MRIIIAGFALVIVSAGPLFAQNPDAVVFSSGDVKITGTGNGLVFPDNTVQTTATLQGPAGPPNTLTIGTVTTGASGSQAAATITGNAPNQVLNLTIPQGPAGPQGPPGPAGSGSGSIIAGATVVQCFNQRSCSCGPGQVVKALLGLSCYDGHFLNNSGIEDLSATGWHAECQYIGKNTFQVLDGNGQPHNLIESLYYIYSEPEEIAIACVTP